MQIHSTDSLKKKENRFQSCVTRVRNDSFYMPVINVIFLNSIQSTDNRSLTFQVTTCKFGLKILFRKYT